MEGRTTKMTYEQIRRFIDTITRFPGNATGDKMLQIVRQIEGALGEARAFRELRQLAHLETALNKARELAEQLALLKAEVSGVAQPPQQIVISPTKQPLRDAELKVIVQKAEDMKREKELTEDTLRIDQRRKRRSTIGTLLDEHHSDGLHWICMHCGFANISIHDSGAAAKRRIHLKYCLKAPPVLVNADEILSKKRPFRPDDNDNQPGRSGAGVSCVN